MSGVKYLTERGGWYYYQRRVPADVAHLDPRRFVRRATRKQCEADAIVVADRINRETEAFWQTLAASGRPASDSSTAYNRAVKRARSFGVEYIPAARLTDPGAVDALADRILKLDQAGLVGSRPAAEALLGTVKAPKYMLADLADMYFEAVAERFIPMADDQVVRFKTPRYRAVHYLVELIGNKPLDEIEREDAIAFREWWLDRVRDEQLSIGSANKNIGQINTMLNTVADRHRLRSDQPFSAMRLKGNNDKRRPPFSREWIETRLLADGALDGLNAEARSVVHVMLNTGMRPSEIVNLDQQRIHLGADVPFVEIRPDGRGVKTDPSIRDVPLVGISLRGMRAFPNGFARYRGRTDSMSGAINKYFAENGLRETDDHTLYSLRHTFQDALTDVEAPERLQAELMGHKFSRPRYGKGPTLAHKARWLEKIAFD